MNRERGGASQQVSTFDESSRGARVDGDDGFSAAVLSDSSTSAVSAPPVAISSGSNSFRRSKAPVHSSLASLLGRKKDVLKSGGQVEKKTKKESKRSAVKSGGPSSKKRLSDISELFSNFVDL